MRPEINKVYEVLLQFNTNGQTTKVTYDESSDNDNLMDLDEIPGQSSVNIAYGEGPSSFMMDLDRDIFDQSSLHTAKIIAEIFESSMTEQQIIRGFRLNHGMILTGNNILPSTHAICVDNGKLKMNYYEGTPLVYTCINSNNDMCINFPVVEITYNGNLLESFPKHMDSDDESYGHFLARKFLAGGQLFIKDFNLAAQTQADILKFYLFYAHNSAKDTNRISFDNLFSLSLLPKVETLDGKKLDTYEELVGWMNNLYQEENVIVVSYDDLIPTSQLRKNGTLSVENLETSNE
jgi:hypothetical protein